MSCKRKDRKVTMFKIILLSIVLANFASYVWSVIGFFRKHSEQDSIKYLALKIASIGVWAASLYSVVTIELTNNLTAVLIVIQASLLWLFWSHTKNVGKRNFSVIYSKDKPQILFTDGLNRFVRHPFYAIYLTCYGSILAFLFNPTLLLFNVFIFAIYFNAAKTEELKFFNSELKDQYENYKQRVPMLIPFLKFNRSQNNTKTESHKENGEGIKGA